MDKEIWNDIKGFPEYKVSTKGRVLSLKQGKSKIITGYDDGYGYRRVSFYQNKKTYKFRVHILVLESFRGPRPEGSQGCHNDGNKDNNNLDNLRWGTPKENGEDKILHETSCRGSEHRSAKLTEDDVIGIRLLLRYGVKQKIIAGRYNVTPQSISAINTGKKWGWFKHK